MYWFQIGPVLRLGGLGALGCGGEHRCMRKECPDCRTVHYQNVKACDACGRPFPISIRRPEEDEEHRKLVGIAAIASTIAATLFYIMVK